MEKFLAVMYRIEAGISAYCLAKGEDMEWKDEGGLAVSICDLEDKVLEEKGFELIKKVVREEYNIKDKNEFERCFNDYIKLARHYLERGLALCEKEILWQWLEVLEAEINRQEFEKQQKVVDNDGGKD